MRSGSKIDARRAGRREFCGKGGRGFDSKTNIADDEIPNTVVVTRE